MEILFKYAWVLFIIVTIINALILKFKSKKYIEKKTELENGYNKYIKGFIIYGNIPWIIMGIGNLTGMTNNMFEYFNPKDMNPIVLIFHASLIILWALGIYWIYFNKGAEFIENHPGLFRKSGFGKNENITAKQIKFFVPLSILAGIIGMIMMWTTNIPIPPILKT